MGKIYYTRTEIIEQVIARRPPGIPMTIGCFEDYQKRGLIPKAMRIKGYGSKRLYEELIIRKIIEIKKVTAKGSKIRLKDLLEPILTE